MNSITLTVVMAARPAAVHREAARRGAGGGTSQSVLRCEPAILAVTFPRDFATVWRGWNGSRPDDVGRPPTVMLAGRVSDRSVGHVCGVVRFSEYGGPPDMPIPTFWKASAADGLSRVSRTLSRAPGSASRWPPPMIEGSRWLRS